MPTLTAPRTERRPGRPKKGSMLKLNLTRELVQRRRWLREMLAYDDLTPEQRMRAQLLLKAL
jgi:hypothetical protein